MRGKPKTVDEQLIFYGYEILPAIIWQTSRQPDKRVFPPLLGLKEHTYFRSKIHDGAINMSSTFQTFRRAKSTHNGFVLKSIQTQQANTHTQSH